MFAAANIKSFKAYDDIKDEIGECKATHCQLVAELKKLQKMKRLKANQASHCSGTRRCLSSSPFSSVDEHI